MFQRVYQKLSTIPTRQVIKTATGVVSVGGIYYVLNNDKNIASCFGAGSSQSLLTFPIAKVEVPGSKPYVPTLTSSLNPSEQCYYLEDICAFGLPSVDNIIVRRPYVASINFRTKCPNWVFEHFTSFPDDEKQAPSEGKLSRKGYEFRPDTAVPTPFRSSPTDFTNSGYARGHLATAASHSNRDLDLHETFYTSNIVPQNGVMNSGDWAKLEKLTRDLTKQYAHVRTLTGPLFMPSWEGGKLYMKYPIVGKNQVSVPTHLFKIVYCTVPRGTSTPKNMQFINKRGVKYKTPSTLPLTVQEQSKGQAQQMSKVAGMTDVVVLAFVMPNEPSANNNSMESYLMPLDAVERASGLNQIPRSDVNSISMNTSI